MNQKRRYYLLSMVLLITALVFIMRRVSRDPAEQVEFERDPSAIVYTKHAKCRMDCRQITEEEIRQVLLEGKINYSKSEPKGKPDPKYALEGTSADGQQLRIVFAADAGKLVVVTAIDLGKEWPCACE